MQPVQFPGNIELVQKYYDQIDVTDIASSAGETAAVRTVGGE